MSKFTGTELWYGVPCSQTMLRQAKFENIKFLDLSLKRYFNFWGSVDVIIYAHQAS